MIELKAYEGLIRNHVELADELGVDIAGCTRKEREERLCVAAYETWGVQMGNHLNGQFAVALYDTETQELFATRDPMGAELIFYYQTASGEVLVETAIKDFFDKPGFKRACNEDMLQFYLGFTYVPGEETLFKGVYKLEPGGYLTYKNDTQALNLGRYWELNFTPDENKTLDEWADAITQAMEDSLASICDKDETPDSFLSGGVDSSYILAKSRARTGYCAVYENQDASEEDEARATAQYLGRNFEGLRVSPEDFFANVDEFLLAFEQPTSDVAGLSLYCAAKKLAGTTELCFSGEGADEFFAGYGVYKNRKRLRLGFDPVYYGATYIMSGSEQSRYLKHYNASKTTKAFMKKRIAPAKQYDDLGWMLYADMKSYFEGSILFNSTKISRGTGLDIRMPFLDKRMFDVARQMPSRFKTDDTGNKIALRRAASRVLPEEVAYRKKLGFPVPVRSWLSSEQYNKDIYRAFKSPTAEKFFDIEELNVLWEVFSGQKPRKHSLWYKRRPGLLWRYVWTIYIFIRWYELFFEE